MKKLNLEIVTPEKIAYSEEVDFITVPSSKGEITILPDHVPLFSSLSEGEVRIHNNKDDYYLAIGGGFIEVTPKKITLLVSRAFKAEELNEKAILRAQKEAEEALKKGATDEDRKAAQALLRSTLVDLKVLKRRRKYKA